MADLFYGTNNYSGRIGGLPSLPVINMFAEQAPSEAGLVLHSRPGITTTGVGVTMGSGPVQALYDVPGVLPSVSLRPFGISNGSLYKKGTLVGALNGSSTASMDAFPDRLFMTLGQSCWTWDGTTLTTIVLPVVTNVPAICVGASRLILLQENTGIFWWSDALSTTVNALSFATAEASPDILYSCLYVGDTLVLFGARTVEFWPSTQDPDTPFAPLTGRVFPVGIKSYGCATKFAGSFAWITDKNQVCVTDPENVISMPDLEQKIAASNSLTNNTLWTFFLEGAEFLAVSLNTGTFVYNHRSQTWSEFQTFGLGKWAPICYDRTNAVFGLSDRGALFKFGDKYTDANISSGGTIERYFRAGTPISLGTQAVYNIQLRTNPGTTPIGDAPATTVSMRTSRDGGFTWGPWQDRDVGFLGAYRNVVQWRSQGRFSNPGILVEFKAPTGVQFRVSGVTYNEPYGNI